MNPQQEKQEVEAKNAEAISAKIAEVRRQMDALSGKAAGAERDAALKSLRAAATELVNVLPSDGIHGPTGRVNPGPQGVPNPEPRDVRRES